MLSSESGSVSEVTAVLRNAPSPIDFSPLPKVTDASVSQSLNARAPMLSSESGNTSAVSPPVVTKAPSPIDFSPLPKVTEVSTMHSSNALLPILSSESGNTSEVSVPHL